ncbi:MAG: hypothetical protein M3R27_07840 [Bacteroidota bacterium]|nr:hypothetical protein [Bacteroidota bacterium]
MKANINITAIALLTLGTIFTSCEKSDLTPATPPVVQNEESNREMRSPLFLGTWKIARYSMNDMDHTPEFSGWLLHIKTGGILVAKKGAMTINGTWSHGTDVKFDYNPALHIRLGSGLPMGQLTDKWYQAAVSNNQLEFKTYGAMGPEYLILERVQN